MQSKAALLPRGENGDASPFVRGPAAAPQDFVLAPIVAGNVLLFLSILGMGFSPFEVAPTLAAGFCAVAATMAVYMVGFALGPNRSWEAFGVLFILMAGFGVFGVGLFLLGMEG